MIYTARNRKNRENQLFGNHFDMDGGFHAVASPLEY